MIKRIVLLGGLLALASFLLAPQLVMAQGAVDGMVRLLESGRLPEARVGTVVEMIAERGNAENLGFLFQQATSPNGFDKDVKLVTLKSLRDASASRNVVPAGDLSPIGELISSQNPALQELAIDLAGAWKVEAAAASLSQIALNNDQPNDIRRLAIDSLVELGPKKAADTVAKLTNAEEPLAIRYLGVAALTNIDIQQAAQAAAHVLSSADTSTDPAAMIDAFLADQRGPAALAAALAGKELSGDVAKMCLRQMYAMGRSDQELVDVLSAAAGIDNNPEPLTEEELQSLVAQVLEKGDPAKGETIFRRAELSCLKCHAVSGAGGEIGPDLSPVGATSPVDYVINSILFPEMAVKEAFLMRSILTVDGKVYQGVVTDENDERVVLRDANGKEIVIPVEDIDGEKEGGSLMPKGLANFLTDEEFLHLTRYISELGKPGPYGIRSEPTIQRWRVLKEVNPALQVDEPPTASEFEAAVAGASDSQWVPTYGKINGELPLEELSFTESPVLYLFAEIEVVEGGEVAVLMNQKTGVHVWLTDDEFRGEDTISTTLVPGRHKIYFRLDARQLGGDTFRAVVTKPADSSAQYTVVGGA